MWAGWAPVTNTRGLSARSSLVTQAVFTPLPVRPYSQLSLLQRSRLEGEGEERHHRPRVGTSRGTGSGSGESPQTEQMLPVPPSVLRGFWVVSMARALTWLWTLLFPATPLNLCAGAPARDVASGKAAPGPAARGPRGSRAPCPLSPSAAWPGVCSGAAPGLLWPQEKPGSRAGGEFRQCDRSLDRNAQLDSAH